MTKKTVKNVSKSPKTAAKMKDSAVTRKGATSKDKKDKHVSVSTKEKNGLGALPFPERPKNCRIIAICNQKGGCGKTTTTVNLAAGLAAMNQRVLVIDLDSQCNATSSLGIDPDEVETSTFDLLANPKNVTAADIVLETEYENLHIAPGSLDLSEFESRVAGEIGRENRLKKALAVVSGLYDFILIDTPPSLGLLSVNALNAAQEVHIAMQAHPFAFDGLTLLLGTIQLVKEELNRDLKVTGIVVTMFDNRTRISREIVDKVCAIEELKPLVYKTVVRQNVKITEASKMRVPVMYYDAASPGSQDYLALSREVALKNQTATMLLSPEKEISAAV